MVQYIVYTVYCVCRDQVVQTLNEMKTAKPSGPSDAILELIAASEEVRIQVMAEICQRLLDGLGIPVKYSGSNLQGKGWHLEPQLLQRHDVLFEHGMKVVERVLRKVFVE